MTKYATNPLRIAPVVALLFGTTAAGPCFETAAAGRPTPALSVVTNLGQTGVKRGNGRMLFWPPKAKSTFLTFVEMAEGARLHCVFTEEDIAPRPGGKGEYLDDIRVPIPPKNVSINGLVKFLRKQAPAFAVWRDKACGWVIHIALKRLLRWGANPLNKAFTFRKTATISYLELHTLRRAFPSVRFENYLPPIDPGMFPFIPDPRYLHTPFHFDTKNLTLRRFLTSGFPYHFSRTDVGGCQLWTATFQARKGKPTGKVIVSLQGLGLLRLPVAPPVGAVERQGR